MSSEITARNNQTPLARIPQDAFDLIFAYLIKNPEFTGIRISCRHLNHLVVQAMNNYMYASISKFIRPLLTRAQHISISLPESGISALTNVLGTPFNFSNLHELRKQTIKIRNILAVVANQIIIYNHPPVDARQLRPTRLAMPQGEGRTQLTHLTEPEEDRINFPFLMHDLSELTMLEYRVSVAGEMNEHDKSYELSSICDKLLHYNNIDRAIEIALLNPDERMKNESLAKISGILAKKDQLEKALHITTLITTDTKDLAFYNISTALATQNRHLTEALRIAKSIPSPGLKNEALQNVIPALTIAGTIEIYEAVEVVQSTIDIEFFRDKTFKQISEWLLKKHDLGQALNIALRITSKGDRDSLLLGIGNAYLADAKPQEALNIAQSISDSMYKQALIIRAKNLTQKSER